MLSLQDERDITAVILAYATGIDRRDYKLFRSCFAEDVTCDYGQGLQWKSADEITKYMVDIHADLGETLHRNTNIVIAPAGQGATARTYVNAILMKRDGALGVHVEGYYDDAFVKTNDGWKFKMRNFVLVRLQGSHPPRP